MNTFMDRVNAIVQKNQMPQNMMALPQPEPVYPDAGMGALENVVSGAPRQAELMNQPHMLAYINPQEEQALRDMGGAGIPGPDGIPVYGFWSDTWSEIKSGGKAKTDTYNSPKNNTPAYVAPVVTNNNNTSAYVAPVVTTPVVNTAPTIPTFNTYYDAIDAGYGGKTVNIGGKNVKAVTADGYTGNTSGNTSGNTGNTGNTSVNTGNTSGNTTSPVNTGSTANNIGAVSNTGEYAGDGFEWEVAPGTNALTRTYTGVNKGLTGSSDTVTGFDNPNVVNNYTAPTTEETTIPEPKPETDSTSFFTGGGADGVGNFGALGDYFGRFGDAVGATEYGTNKIKESKYKPRTFTQDEVDAFTTENTGREGLANLLTPFDNAKYYGGNLLTEISPGVYQDLTGGGFTTNKAGYKDRIYGVADDFSNNAPMVQGNMSNQEFATALARQRLLRTKPPSQGAYFGSFALDRLSPIPGLGGMAINPGIDRRQESIDAQLDAIQAGAIPEYDKENNYIGYRDKEGDALIRYNPNPKAPKPASQASYGSLNVGSEQNDEAPAQVVYASQKAKDVYSRYYKGGSGFGMPYWLRRYASGNVVDMDLQRVTKDGVDYYQDQTGILIPMSELPGLKMVAE
mgnify:FL=1